MVPQTLRLNALYVPLRDSDVDGLVYVRTPPLSIQLFHYFTPSSKDKHSLDNRQDKHTESQEIPQRASSCAKGAVSCISKARNNVAIVVQLFIDHSTVDLDSCKRQGGRLKDRCRAHELDGSRSFH